MRPQPGDQDSQIRPSYADLLGCEVPALARLAGDPFREGAS